MAVFWVYCREEGVVGGGLAGTHSPGSCFGTARIPVGVPVGANGWRCSQHNKSTLAMEYIKNGAHNALGLCYELRSPVHGPCLHHSGPTSLDSNLVTFGGRYPTPYEPLGGGIICQGQLPHKETGIFWTRPKTSARRARLSKKSLPLHS